MSVIDEVCYKNGHNVQSHIVSDIADPVLKVVLHKYEFVCTKCGKSRHEIEKYKKSGHAKKIEKRRNGNDTASTTGTEKVSQDPIDEPVAGAERPVSEPEVPQDLSPGSGA